MKGDAFFCVCIPTIRFEIPAICGQNFRTGALLLPLLDEEELLEEDGDDDGVDELEELLLPDPKALRKKPPALVPLFR